MISVLIPAFGRVQLLEELLQCYLNQTAVDTECIILNDYGAHQLYYKDPRITVVNADRYASVGEKRNALAAMANGQWITFWDDDDLYLSGHLQSLLDLVPRFVSGLASRQYRNWIDSAGKLYRYDFSPLLHTLLIDNQTFQSIGGFPPISVDEDVALMQAIMAQSLLIGPSSQDDVSPTCIIRQSTGHYHLSDYNDGNAYDSINGLVQSTNQPVGDYTLSPHWDVDYNKKAYDSWSAVLAFRGH